MLLNTIGLLFKLFLKIKYSIIVEMWKKTIYKTNDS